jgi:uracil-DNA glycosylase
MAELLSAIRDCRACGGLPLGPGPLVQADPAARILIAGQAPGRRAHLAGRLFDDPSGDRLRSWLGVSTEEFYDPVRFATAPMGFCYPGTGPTGDIAPRIECAPLWRGRLLALLANVVLTVVIGRHAQARHLPDSMAVTLAEAIRARPVEDSDIVLLPHPSPRNNRWLRANPWFETETLPKVRARVRIALGRHR